MGSAIVRGAAQICSLPLPWETQERDIPALQEASAQSSHRYRDAQWLDCGA